MNLDYSGAVSFTNSYFALADGLVSGFENCLAENVVLDWFGKTIKGKSNVAAFMNTHKVNSRHVFKDINPTENIGYNRKPNWRTRRKLKTSSELSSLNISIENSSSCNSTPVNEIISMGDRSRSPAKIDAEGNHLEESNLTFELHDDAVSTLFKLENIKSTNVEEIQEKINQISLQEKLNTKSPGKSESKNVNGSEFILSPMKYIEAYGEVLFSKKSRRQSGWNECKLISASSTQTWRKACKLQIAYSSQKICLQEVLSPNNLNAVNCSTNFDNSQQKLLSLDQLTELSNKLVPNVNNFAGYLRNVNTAKEEEEFFKNLSEYLSKNEAHKLALVPQYINGQLLFQKTNCVSQEDYHNGFIFNHLIHVIIYEGQTLFRDIEDSQINLTVIISN